MRLAWGMLLILACSGDDSNIFGYRSGSRLRAHVYDGDGVRLLIDFRDTKLNLNCTFARAEDGKWHCLPGLGSEIAFTDAQCTQPVLVNDDHCSSTPPPYALFTPPSRGYCGLPVVTAANTVVYTVGQKLPDGPTYTAAIDGCYPASSSTANLYAVTRVDPAMFAAADETFVEHGPLLTRLLEGEDGSRYVAAIANPQKIDCNLMPYSAEPSQSVRCVTGQMLFADPYFYGDAQCSMAVGYEDASCQPPQLVWRSMAAPCAPAPWGLFTSGAKLDPAMVSIGSGGACMAYMGTGEQFFATGAAVPPDSLPEIRSVAVGSGTLTVYQRATASGEGLGLPASGFIHRQLDIVCNPTPAADGSLRCDGFPRVRVGDADYYQDAACTQGVIDARTTCGIAPPPFGVRTMFTGTNCVAEKIQATFDLGPVVHPTALFIKTASGCQPYTLDPDAEYHQVGAEGDLSRLPIVKELVE